VVDHSNRAAAFDTLWLRGEFIMKGASFCIPRQKHIRGQFMNAIYDGRIINMKRSAIGLLALTSVFVAEVKLSADAQATAAGAGMVVVYPSIAVTVNKAVVLRVPKRASRVSVTQPRIAEAVVVAPDQILINGKAVGTTSLVVWFEENKTRKK
jgi:Flp pilus assembly secretin CpaC